MSGLCIKQNKAPGKPKSYTERSLKSEGEFDLFQLEIKSDKELCAKNLCNEVSDSEHEVKEHLKPTHKKILKLNK